MFEANKYTNFVKDNNERIWGKRVVPEIETPGRTLKPVESDPMGLKPTDPGAKLDSGKLMAGVLFDFSRALTEVAKVGTFGANKYSRGGWLSVKDGEIRYFDAMVRHLLAMNTQEVDVDSDCLHLAQVAWNALATLEFKLRAAKNCAESE